MLDVSIFGAELIKDTAKAAQWIRVGVEEAMSGGVTVRELFRPEIIAELEKHIDSSTLDSTTVFDVFYDACPAEDTATTTAVADPPKRATPIDRESVGQAIHDFLSIQAAPLPFRVIKQYVEMNGGFTITQAQWNTLNKKIPGLQMVGERQHACWKVVG